LGLVITGLEFDIFEEDPIAAEAALEAERFDKMIAGGHASDWGSARAAK
jgi:hypothetical protein